MNTRHTHFHEPEELSAADLITIVDANKKREIHLSRLHDHAAYSNADMMRMYGPYLRDFDHKDGHKLSEGTLSPREARLLETWFRDFRSLYSVTRANTEYDAELSRERNKGFELQKAFDELQARYDSDKARGHKVRDELEEANEQMAAEGKKLIARIKELEGYLETADKENKRLGGKHRQHKDELAALHEKRRQLEAQIGTLNVFVEHGRHLDEMLGAAERRIEELTGKPYSSRAVFDNSKKAEVAKDARLSNIVVLP